MNSLVINSFKHFNSFKLPAQYFSLTRQFSVTGVKPLKQIQETQNGKELIIEGVYVESPRAKHMVKLDSEHKCPLCALDLDVKHTDVLILSQFLRSDGCMLPKRITGLCNMQQIKVSTLVAMAQKAGLMPNFAPANSKRDPTKRFGAKKYNKYFDESTIKVKNKVY